MNSTLIRVLQRAPGFRSLAAQVNPVWFFRITRWCAVFAGHVAPQVRSRRKIFHDVLRGDFSEAELRAREARYLYCSRIAKDLEIAWNNWQHRQSAWIVLEGEAHLQQTLVKNRGAMLVSPHNYGFSKIVAPVLADRGYKVHRGGNGGIKAVGKRARWGENERGKWNYLNYKDEYWHRVQLLRAVQHTLAANEVVHVSLRGFQTGEEDKRIEFFGRTYFLDAKWFRIFQICQAPVLPCFAVGPDESDKIRIVIHPALEQGKDMARQLAVIQAGYITRYPEYGRLWKSVYVDRDKW